MALFAVLFICFVGWIWEMAQWDVDHEDDEE